MTRRNSESGRLIRLLSIVFFGLVFLLGLVFLKPVIITSGSMEPAMPTGSLAMASRKAATSHIEAGDVILFAFGEGEVAHRVIEITEDGYKTKGDANDTPDFSPVPEDAVKGKVLFAIPYLGYLAAFMQNHLYITIAFAIFGYFICRWRRERREKHDQKTE